MIIAIGGKRGSGKDASAESLIKRHGFIRIALADKLKDLCSEVTSISRTDMDDPILKDQPFKTPFILFSSHLQYLLDLVEYDGFKVTEEAYKAIFKEFNNKPILSIRHLLQTVGTDILRTHVSDTIWLEYFRQETKEVHSNIIVTDARFKNERDYLKSLGAILILVRRPNVADATRILATELHISENQLGEEAEYDVIINNVTCVNGLQSDISMWYTTKYKYANQSNNR
jgi:dephospho-CoA kinase